MKTNTNIFTSLILILAIAAISCKKESTANETIKKLYKNYQLGEISECNYNGEQVYTAGLNATDAGSQVFDKEGNQIGNCNYAWGGVDSICHQLTGCEIIYRVKDNIWGKPAVDKYGLAR